MQELLVCGYADCADYADSHSAIGFYLREARGMRIREINQSMNFLKKLFGSRQTAPKNAAVFNNIVSAKVVGIQKHPNADRLRLVKVDVGGRIIEPVICGAFNFEVGDIVALALPGAKIAQNIHTDNHQGFILEKTKIRGIESQGMICAAFELGLAKEPGQKIIILKTDVTPGSQFSPKMIR